MRDDQDTPTISWPNYHSGANGDYQPVFAEGPVHELLRTARTASGRIEWFPAHPHEGGVSADGPFATAARAGPKHRDRSSLQPRCGAGRRDGTGRPADGPSGRRIDLPPLRRLQLGSRLRGALVRHRAAGHRDQGRPVPAWRSSRTTSATSRRGCNPRPVHRKKTMTTNAYRPTSDLVQEQRSTRPPTDEKATRWRGARSSS